LGTTFARRITLFGGRSTTRTVSREKKIRLFSRREKRESVRWAPEGGEFFCVLTGTERKALLPPILGFSPTLSRGGGGEAYLENGAKPKVGRAERFISEGWPGYMIEPSIRKKRL